MSKESAAVISWRKRTKARMIEAMGSKCYLCGLVDVPQVYDFHHLEPLEKKFGFGGMRANPTAWSKAIVELRKCVMLCSNCHRKVTAGCVVLGGAKTTFNEDFSSYGTPVPKRVKVIFANCAFCGKEFQKYTAAHRYCDEVCRKKTVLDLYDDAPRLRPRKVKRPSKVRLQELVDTTSWSAIGRMYGVSDNAIKKWARDLGVVFSVRPYVRKHT